MTEDERHDPGAPERPGQAEPDATELPAFEPMTDAEAAFAARLAEDLARVLGEGIAIEDLELDGDGPVRIRAVCLVEGAVRELEATGDTSLDAYRDIVRQAAELRLAAAWWRLVAPV